MNNFKMIRMAHDKDLYKKKNIYAKKCMCPHIPAKKLYLQHITIQFLYFTL